MDILMALAAANPTLVPVYDPGPKDTKIKDKSVKIALFFSKISFIIKLSTISILLLIFLSK